MIPTRKQFKKWTLPSKYTVVGVWLAAVLFVIGYFLPVDVIRNIFREAGEVEVSIANQEETRFAHVYSVQRRQYKGADIPSIYELATWYRVRVRNTENRTIHITEISFNNGVGEHAQPVPQPFFKSVVYPGGKISLNNPITLPLKLEPNDFLEFYALLPVVVPKRAAAVILTSLRFHKSDIDTDIERFLYGEEPEFITSNYLSISGADEERELVEGRLLKPEHLGDIWMTRNLLYVLPEGILFIDIKEKPRDGFFYRETIELFNNSLDALRAIEKHPVSLFLPRFPLYTLTFTKADGQKMLKYLRPSKMGLDLKPM